VVQVSGLVVGVDGSTQSEHALDWALREAALRGVPLVAVHAWVRTWDDPTGQMPVRSHPDDLEGTITAKQTYVQSLVDGALERAGSSAAAGTRAPGVTARQVHGWPGDALLTVAEHESADLVVIGRSGLGRFGRFMLGSVSSSVVQHATLPVTVVTDGAESQDTRDSSGPPRVVVGVDGSDASVAALREAAAVARRLDGMLDAVHAWEITTISPLPASVGWVPPLDDYEDWAHAQLHDAVATVNLGLAADRVRETVVHAPPTRGLLEASAGAERLVVGNRGRGGFERLVLGSVSRQVLESAPCPVTVVRAR
jgi:nucleotide-binding universal stress UspA family protein